MHSECSKVSYYQPKNQHFFIINLQSKFCAIFFSKINPDAHFGTKINTFTFYKGDGGGGGVNSPQKPKKCKKWRFYVFHNKYYIPDAKIYTVIMWIQIHARGVKNFSY